MDDVRRENLDREDEYARDTDVVERRRLNWSAIVAGVVATLGLQILLMYLGSALGLSAFDPYDISHPKPGLPWSAISYLIITALGSSFFGAWVAGHWANLNEAEDAFMHGALTWAVTGMFVAAGLGGMAIAGLTTPDSSQSTLMSQADTRGDSKDSTGRPLAYMPLSDERFTSFMLSRAKSWQEMSPGGQKGSEEAVNVSAEPGKTVSYRGREVKVDPDDIAKDDRFISYVTSNTNMDEKQAKEFLKAEKESIARAEAESQRRWQTTHARELEQVDRERSAASSVAWTMTIAAFLSLCAALGGSYLGWRQRYNNHGMAARRENPPAPGSNIRTEGV